MIININEIVSFSILNKVWSSFEIVRIKKKNEKNLSQETIVTHIT